MAEQTPSPRPFDPTAVLEVIDDHGHDEVATALRRCEDVLLREAAYRPALRTDAWLLRKLHEAIAAVCVAPMVVV